jgi:hypothetical protein
MDMYFPLFRDVLEMRGQFLTFLPWYEISFWDKTSYPGKLYLHNEDTVYIIALTAWCCGHRLRVGSNLARVKYF